MPLFLFDVRFWMIVGPFMAFAAWCTLRVKTTFARFEKVGVRSGMTGAQAAAAVAQCGGAQVTIERVGGFLSDHYDPRTKTLRLSPKVYDGRSVASIAVAAHEAGHAIQDLERYPALAFRSSIVPAVAIGSQAWMLFFIVGLLLHMTGLALVGVGLFALVVVFQIITLPVEFDASRRAKAVLAGSGIVATEEEARGVSKVLDAAAMTYVAGVLVSIAQLLYFVMLLTRRN